LDAFYKMRLGVLLESESRRHKVCWEGDVDRVGRQCGVVTEEFEAKGICDGSEDTFGG
jgi:hypothetical protein